MGTRGCAAREGTGTQVGTARLGRGTQGRGSVQQERGQGHGVGTARLGRGHGGRGHGDTRTLGTRGHRDTRTWGYGTQGHKNTGDMGTQGHKDMGTQVHAARQGPPQSQAAPGGPRGPGAVSRGEGTPSPAVPMPAVPVPKPPATHPMPRASGMCPGVGRAPKPMLNYRNYGTSSAASPSPSLSPCPAEVINHS